MDLPEAALAKLLAAQKELEEGDITEKGFRKRYDQIMAQYAPQQSQPQSPLVPTSSATFAPSSSATSIRSFAADGPGHFRHASGFDSLYSNTIPGSPTPPPVDEDELFVPDEHYLSTLTNLQMPLDPRGIPESTNTDPLNVKLRLSTFDNLPSILRHRAAKNGDIVAFQRLDDKGKEVQSITWSKLAARAERVSQSLREQSGLFRGDRVVLMYSQQDPIEFIIALMGCFLAGMVGVPVNPEHVSQFLQPVLEDTNARIVLTTESLYKRIIKYPQLASLASYWKTNEWGNFKGSLPPLQVPDLAYIEFLKSGKGDTRGVVISHRTILHQMKCLMALTQYQSGGGKRVVDNVLCSLDIRRSTGLIMGVLLTVYAGNKVTFLSPEAMATPGLYAYLISSLRATILLSDYPALKGVCYNYQAHPNQTRQFTKRSEPSLASIRWCLVDVPAVDPEFLAVLSDRWLKPLGNKRANDVVAPMLTLTEHGGMVIATNDFITPNGGPSELTVSISALSKNKIVLADGDESDSLKLCSFGYPVPDVTVAVVDQDTRILCEQMTVGEIWIDSPSLSGGIWANSEETDRTFHAHCFGQQGELQTTFLRTGLLGFLYNSKLYVLGTKMDRLIQPGSELGDLRYQYSQYLMESVLRNVPELYDGCLFQISIGLTESASEPQLANILVLESPRAGQPGVPVNFRTVPYTFLDNMASQAMAVLRQKYDFRVYCCVICTPGQAPRTLRSGKPDIAKLACRRAFLAGKLPAVHVKFNYDNLALKMPSCEDSKGGIWNSMVSRIRGQQLSMAGNDQQYTGVDMRNTVLDDRTVTKLDQFDSILSLLKWRIQRQPDELAYKSIAGGGVSRETSWRQFGVRVSSVYSYLTGHLQIKPGTVVGLIYTQSEDYVYAVYACLFAGAIVLPLNPVDITRLEEDVPLLIRIISQFRVKVLIGNTETQRIMEDKQIAFFLKTRQSKLPKLHNTAKIKASDSSKQIKNITPPVSKGAVLVWVYTNADQHYTASFFTHQQLMGMCKIQKETCQMGATRPIIGCVRANVGLGFLYTCCLGVYAGAFTILLSPVEYAVNPASYFVTSSRYKVKDGYATPQMLKHAAKRLNQPRNINLSELRNLVVPVPCRADGEIVSQTRVTFANAGLQSVAINLAYGPACNPMATTRSYMHVDYVDLWLDPVALREGRVSIVNPNNNPNALHLIDSGMVPINTQIAIVNPETKLLCHTGEIGEIWIVSEGNHMGEAVQGYTSGKINTGNVSEIGDGEPGIKYMRTGDLGFLHTVTGGNGMEMQVLFVVGSLKHTFEVNGLQHFVEDVESTVVGSHNTISDCIVAVCGGIVCLIVETSALPKYFCSIAAVVANYVASENHFIPNIISFVGKDGIPRSRLGEKQRKKMLQLYTGVAKLGPGQQFKALANITINPVDFNHQ